VRPAVIAGAIVAAAAVGAGAWFGIDALRRGGERQAAVQAVPDAPTRYEGVSDVGQAAAAMEPGTTPMAQRSAVIGLLNKRNGASRDLTLRPGQSMRVGDTIVRLRACERTADWEAQQLTGAFLQLDVQEADRRWRRAFSGWLFKERPNLNVVLHPVYDVWVKSCTMRFPDKGPATISLSGDRPAAPSSARKSAAPAANGDAPAEPDPPESAASSNAT
jgi:hypothetical protein